ncbi:MAG: hypothetical protein QM739_04045 [Propionivibrio sp.]
MKKFVKGVVASAGVALASSAMAAGTYDALTSAIDVTEVSLAIVAVGAVTMGPKVVMWCVRKIQSMVGR